MTAVSTRLATGRLHYAWVIIGLTFVVIVVTAGVRATPGVLIVPFEDEFHWSRATISFAIGVNLLVYGLIGPFAAAAMDRFGVRRTMALSLAVAAVGVALSPLMRDPWQLVLLWGLVVGLSTGFVGAYLAAYIAARWFHARQGMVVGLLTAANAAGQLIFLPTNAALIAYAGWRAMVLVLAGVVLLVVPLLLLMRDHPQDIGLFAYGDTTGESLAARPNGNLVAAAFLALGDGARVRDFWLISGGYFICGASTMGLIGTHLIPACVDHGLTEVTAAGLLAATGVFAVIGGTASGWLSELCPATFRRSRTMRIRAASNCRFTRSPNRRRLAARSTRQRKRAQRPSTCWRHRSCMPSVSSSSSERQRCACPLYTNGQKWRSSRADLPPMARASSSYSATKWQDSLSSY
jgi:MFS family permease